MSPRPYNLGLRQTSAEQTRARIIAAAREILSGEDFDGLSVDAIARRAGVARMTVYYQFGSRQGLLEAMYDDFASRIILPNLSSIEQEPDAAIRLLQLIDLSAQFWASERLIIRRLRGITAIDEDVNESIHKREAIRKARLLELIRAIGAQYGWTATLSIADASAVIASLISFETFDALAAPEESPERTAELIKESVRMILNLRTDPLEGIIGSAAASDLPEDSSINHDHTIYGERD